MTLQVGDLEAQAAGLARGGTARCVVVPADRLPAELWPLLLERAPVCLVSRLEDDRVVATTLHTAGDVSGAGEEAARLFARGRSDAAVSGDTVVTVFFPVPKLVLVGGGPIAEALAAQAGLLGWDAVATGDVSTATGLIAGLASIDQVVVTAHDVEVAGPALEVALTGAAVYVAALGAPAMQQLRADWLAMRGITDLSRLYTPPASTSAPTAPPRWRSPSSPRRWPCAPAAPDGRSATADRPPAAARESLTSPPPGGAARLHSTADPRARESEGRPAMADDPVEVLRTLWSADDGVRDEVDDLCGPQKNCRNMKDVTFDGFGEPGSDSADLGSAWRSRLAREGKLGASSIADLVLGQASQR
ncbi:MAG: XdhC family protein [Nocardioides sp.]